MGFRDAVEQAAKEIGGSDYYKFKEGDNKLRILTEPVRKDSRFGYGICYEGAPYCSKEAMEKAYQEAIAKGLAEGKKASEVRRPTLGTKFVCWAYDLSAKRLTILSIPFGVAQELLTNMVDEEGGWDVWPMPRNINIKAKDAGKTIVKYTLVISPKEIAVEEEVLKELETKTPIDQMIEKEKVNQKLKMENGGTPQEGVPDYPDDEINPDDIPF